MFYVHTTFVSTHSAYELSRKGLGHKVSRQLYALQHPYPLRGCNSDLAQYSITPSLRVAGSEDENDEDSGSTELAEVLPDEACGL